MSQAGTETRPSGRWTLPGVVGLAVPVATGALFAAWATLAGMPGAHVLTAALTVVLTQMLPGVVLWRAVRPVGRGWWAEDLALGFAVGSMVAILAQVPAGLAGLPWLSGPLVWLIAGAVLAVPATRRRVLDARTLTLPWWWAPAVTASVLVSAPQLLGYFRISPLDWPDGSRALRVDTYLHLALSGQLAHRGPTTFPWVQSEPLGYHWFSHAWIAQVGTTSTAELEEVLLRFMPLLVALVVPFAVAAAALRLTGLAWAAPVAALLTVGSGMANPLGAALPRAAMSPLSPSLGLSVPMLMAGVVLLCLRWRGTAGAGSAVLLLLTATVAAGTKGSTTPLLVAGIGVAGLAMLLQRRWTLVRRLFVDGVITAAGLALAVVLVFRGSGAGLHLSLSDAAGQTWAAAVLGTDTALVRSLDTGLAVVGVLTPGLLGLVVLCDRSWRRRPLSWLLLGSGIAGVGAVAVFAHPGRSQYYFSLNAIPLLALFATCGLVVLRRHVPLRLAGGTVLVGGVTGLLATYGPKVVLGPATAELERTLLMIALSATAVLAGLVAGFLVGRPAGRGGLVAVAVVGLSTVASGFSMTWNAVRLPLPAEAAAVAVTAPRAASRGQISAARWIRDHSAPDEMVITNRHCSVPVSGLRGCDSRRWLVAAYTERQVLLEGWTATPRSAKEGPEGRDSIRVAYWDQDLQRLNDDFIAKPTPAGAEELRRRGVRWVYADHTRPWSRQLERFARTSRRFPGVDVYELSDSVNASASS